MVLVSRDVAAKVCEGVRGGSLYSEESNDDVIPYHMAYPKKSTIQ